MHPIAVRYLQSFGDAPDRMLHNLFGTQASVPELVADLAPEPVGVCRSQVVELQGSLGIHANAQVVVHGFLLSLQQSGGYQD